MANNKSITQAIQPATSSVDVPPLHRPFSWLHGAMENSVSAKFAAQVMDVAAGTKVVAQIMRRHVQNLHNIADETPGVVLLMSPGDIDALAGLAATALDNLYDAAASQVAALEQNALKGVKA